MRIGLLGGTFNPVHYGHLRAAEEVRGRLSLDKVLFIPAGVPPLKSFDLADAGLRYEMTELAVSSNVFFEVSDIECKSPGVSYSVDTVSRLKEAYRGAELYFILGVDAFMDLPNWREPERLAGLTDFVVVNRPPHAFTELVSSPYVELEELGGEGGEEGLRRVPLRGGRTALLLEITPLDISATAIRALIREGGSIKYLLPENVESFIILHGLYAGK
jgi:nicotinate-nucleotide adenylyltransferase